jgi:uncharacterized membrane protein YphA (DoxX/SURF4 family)
VKQRILFAIRIGLAGIFIYSGAAKIIGPSQNFQAAIDNYRVLHADMSPYAAVLVPWLEYLGGVYLAFGVWESAAIGALWALDTLFLGVTVSAIARGLSINGCGCLGEAVELTLPQAVGLDAVIWFLFAALFISKKK